jgi:hypothetical protein
MSGGTKILVTDEGGELYLIDLSKLKPTALMDVIKSSDEDDVILTVSVTQLVGKTIADIFAAGMQFSMSPPRSAARARSTAAGSDRKRDRKDTQAIRAWATAQGLEMSERGRIPAEIEDKYYAAHPGVPQPQFTG